MPDEVYDAEFTHEQPKALALRETASEITEHIAIMGERSKMLDAVRNMGLSQLAGNPHLLTAYPGANGQQRFRLTKDGASRVARICGLVKEAPEWDRELTGEYKDDNGDARYHASCTVRVSFPGGGSAEDIGSADSAEGLFKGKALTPTVKENIRKHAYANGFVRAVESLLGFGGLVESDLQKAHCDPSAVPSVEFRKGGQSADRAAKSVAASAGDDDSLRAKGRELLASVDVEAQADVDEIVCALATWKNKEGREVAGKPLSMLNGAWLQTTVEKIATVCEFAKKRGEFGKDAVLALVPEARAARRG